MEKCLFVLLVAASLLSGGASSTHAANEKASCVGLILSDHAQWGDMPELIQGTREFAAGMGITPGAFISGVAQQHLGSHAVCGNE